MMFWKRGKSLALGGNKTKHSALAMFSQTSGKLHLLASLSKAGNIYIYISGSLGGTNQCSCFYLMLEKEPAPETPFLTQHTCKTPSRTFRLGFPVIYTQHIATVITLRREYGSASSAISSDNFHTNKVMKRTNR